MPKLPELVMQEVDVVGVESREEFKNRKMVLYSCIRSAIRKRSIAEQKKSDSKSK